MDRVHLRNVFEVEAAGGDEDLDIRFEGQGGGKCYPKAANV